MTGTLNASLAGLQARFPGHPDAPSPVGDLGSVFLGGRRIWTFRIEDTHWDGASQLLEVPWPAALVPHLVGAAETKLEVSTEPGQPPSYLAKASVTFGGNTGDLALVDPLDGEPLVVNQWGRMAKSFEAVDEKLTRAVLESAKQLTGLLNEKLGLEAFITGGTLLGLVRDGQLITTDAGLAYLSKHENPSDVVLESYEVERVLAEAGLELVRHSSGHLQVVFDAADYSDGYSVDIFSYFITEGWFHGTSHARVRAGDVTILPLGTLAHGGVDLPVPADAAQLLTAIYGPAWHTPDPAFTFVTPESSGRRFYWWLNHYDPFREDWEFHHRRRITAGVPTDPSALANWLLANLEPASTILEFGAGMGQDALALAAAGHHVLASDYSRPAMVHAQSLADDGGVKATARFEVTNVNSVRHMADAVQNAAALAGPGTPITVVARNLFDNLHFLGRDNVLLAISHVLARGGRAYLQMRNPKAHKQPRDAGEPLGERIFDPWEFTSRLAHYGLEVLEQNFIPEPGPSGASLSYIIGKVSP